MTSGDARQRVEWVDIAKGMAILLVVLYHAVLFADARGWVPSYVPKINDQLGTFRMPLFFLASGLFAATTLGSSWATVLRKRVLFFAYLYCVWVAIRFAFFAVVTNANTPGEGHHPIDLLISLVLPQTGLWFLYALAVFSAVGKLVWRLPVALQLATAAVLSAVAGAGLLGIDNFAWKRMAMYFVFFLVGAHLSAPIRRVVSRTAPVHAGIALTAYGVAAAASFKLSLAAVPGVLLAVSALAVWAGLSIAVVLTDGAPGRVLSNLGGRTIDIYLPHVMIIGGVSAAMAAGGLDPSASPVGIIAVAALVIVAVPGSLLIATLLRRVGARWLFRLPTTLAPRSAPAGRRP